MLVDREKMREHFRRHTDDDPDDPDRERAMLGAVLWILAGSLPLFVGFVMVATTDPLPAFSVLLVGALVVGVGVARFFALAYRR